MKASGSSGVKGSESRHLLLSATPVKTETTVFAWVVDEEIRIVTGTQGPATGTRRTVIADGVVKRTSSLDGNVILLRSRSPTPLAIVDAGAKTWFGYEASALAKSGMQGGPLLEGLGVDAQGNTFAPAEPFNAKEGASRERIGEWDVRLFMATQRGPGGMETAMWLADRPGGIANDAGLATMRAIYSKKGGPLEPYFASLAKRPGFPVQWIFRMVYPNGVQTVVTITTTSVRQERVPREELDIPAGFTRVPDPLGIQAEKP